MYQVFARKWRPQGFDDLIGQEPVARTLRNAIEARRLAHAYIFAGLRGTGKTTVARILAKCLNCESGPTATPCGQCTPCREITEGRAIDVLEMDAASRTGVDDIRELQEVVAYAPVRDRYKVLIIDEAHMLSKPAFNALLKTLEEPPPRVVFVLATTEIQKILPTILSRCQVFEFRRVTPRELAVHLRKVCDAEGIRVSDPILDRVARAGEGSVRDSLSVLERLVAFGGETISEDDALYVLGAVRIEVLARLLGALARRDAGGMLTVLDALVAEGHDLLHVWSELIAALRDLLLLGALPDRADLLSRAPDETAALREAVEGFGREDLVRSFQILADLEPALKGSAQPRYLFEAALIRLADLAMVRPIEEILDGLAPEGVAAPPARPAPARLSSPSPADPAPPPPQKKNPAEQTAAPSPVPPPRAEEFPTAFRAALREASTILDVMLDEASRIAFDGRGLELTFPPEAAATRRRIEKPESLDRLRAAATSAAGVPVVVKIAGPEPEVGGTAPSTPAPSAAPHPAAASRDRRPPGPPATPKSRPGSRPGDPDALMASAKNDPGVARLLHEFGAQVVEIRALDPPAETADDDAPPEQEVR